MSISTFKGGIAIGDIVAIFHSDFSNSDPDLLSIKFAEMGGGNPVASHDAAAPGGKATVRLKAPAIGPLEVFLDTGNQKDSGLLTVQANGATVHSEAIQGSVRWVYTVGV